jgi:hypothetical protein
VALDPPPYDTSPAITRPEINLDIRGGSYFGLGVCTYLPNRIPVTTHTATGDPVLYIDAAVFYDDSEGNTFGGFWANWKISVVPIELRDGFNRTDWNTPTLFQTMLRGPFWSGEKLEVGDTDGNKALRPQLNYWLMGRLG